MEYKFLSQKFYEDYPEQDYSEIERKDNRPYTMVCLSVNDCIVALPMRSHINHNNAYITNRADNCGIDFSKAVIISNSDYIDNSRKPYIRNNEFAYLKGKDRILKNKFNRYLQSYIGAKESNDPNRLKRFEYSTLPYFEDVVDYKSLVSNGIERDSSELITV